MPLAATSRRHLRNLTALLIGSLALFACSEGGPVEMPSPTSLSVALELGMDASLQAPASVRLEVRDATGGLLGSAELGGALGDRDWLIEVGSMPGDAELLLEARIHGGTGTPVLWSGEKELRTQAGGSTQASIQLRAGGPENADVTSVTIEAGGSLTMTVGDTLQLPLLVVGGDPANAVLNTGDPGIVSVDMATGGLVGVAPGTTLVRVLAGLHQATAEVEVVDRLVSLVLLPEEVTFSALGESLRLAATGLGSTGVEVPLPGDVEWRVEGDGSVEVDGSGRVTALGNGSARVIASLAEAPGVSGEASFTVLQEASALEVVLGTGQSGEVGEPLGEAPTIRAVDARGNPVPGIEVRFDPAPRSGAVATPRSITDQDGYASSGSWTLGTDPGVQSLGISVDGLAPLTIQAEARAGAPAQLVPLTVGFQGGTVGEVVDQTPVVMVLDRLGNPLPGLEVEFRIVSGGGSVSDDRPLTDEVGTASPGRWTLGGAVGTQRLEARIGGVVPVSFEVDASAGPPVALHVVEGDGQTATVGTDLPIAPAVQIRDAFGNGLPGLAVEFQVTGGGGSVTGGSATTNALGMATVGSWTLGETAGAQTLGVTAAGLTSTIQATAEPGDPDQLVMTAGNGQSAPMGTALPIAPSVQLLDAFGNPVPNVAVEFEVTGGGGSVTGGSTTTDAAGMATLGSWTLGPDAGLNTLLASAGGLTVTFEATAQACIPLALAVGEVSSLSLDGSVALCITAGEATQEFTLVPSNTSTDALHLRTTATGVTGVTGPPSPAPALGGLLGVDDSPPADDSVRRGPSLAALRSGASRTPLRSELDAPAPAIVPGVPTVGDLWDLNVAPSCDLPLDLRTGMVMGVGDHFIVVSDVDNPSGGFSVPQLDSILAEADTLVHPVITDHFGSPTDLDGNGRVVLFLTGALNELSPPASSTVVPGYFETRDLYPSLDCPGSNEGEIIYLMVPDPSGQINGNVRTVPSVRGSVIGVLAETLQSLVSASRRAHITFAAEFEEPWLDAALSGVARELVFYRAAGLAPRQDIQLSTLTSGATASQRVAAFNAYQNTNFGRLRPWLQRPDTTGAFASQQSLANQGVAWAFLRYAADRVGGDETLFWRSIVDSPLSGRDNLAATIGAGVDEWYSDFAIGIYGDNAVAGLPEIHRHRSWNFRSVYGGLGGVPLVPRNLGDGVPLNLAHSPGGGSSFLRFAVPALGSAQLELEDTGAASGPLPVRVLRTR